MIGRRLLACLCGVLMVGPVQAAPPAAAAAAAQYLYVLHLVPRLYATAAWTDADRAAVDAHFARLKDAATRGQVILAGRTRESLEQTFGIVIFEAADEQAAESFMAADPAVAAGVMTATLHPYAVSVARER